MYSSGGTSTRGYLPQIGKFCKISTICLISSQLDYPCPS
uniref:Uncharacterized protein n=1 Tax=Setaria italica TaxID=4555 RepID=K4ANG4_SETIT